MTLHWQYVKNPNMTRCGWISGNFAERPEYVTCKRCRRWLITWGFLR